MIFHLRTPILHWFYHFLWVYLLTNSEFSCLAMMAKQYPVSRPTSMPHIPNQLHCIQKSAHEVLGTILGTWTMPAFTKHNLLTHFIWTYICLSAAPLCYTCFDCGRGYPYFIDPVRGLALLYLCVDLILTCEKSTRFSEANTRNKHKCGQTRSLFSSSLVSPAREAISYIYI